MAAHAENLMPSDDARNQPPVQPPLRLWAVLPAWCFLLAGLVALGSAVLLPAAESLTQARYHRDVSLTWEQERLDRLARHEAYLASIQAREPATIEQLRAMQLNLYPPGTTLLGELPADPGRASASVFELLEPTPHVTPPPPEPVRSRLARWATGERSRVWLLALGSLLVLLGLLPGSVTSSVPGSSPHGASRPAGAATVAA
jgi:hypothetical protein